MESLSPFKTTGATLSGTVVTVSGARLRPCYQQVRACAGPMVNIDLPFMQVYGEPRLSLLGDSTRQAIFELLARQPCSVGELAEQLPVSRPAVSHHLRVLKDGGLVVYRSDGTRRVYQLNPEGVEALRSYLDRVWEKATLYSPGTSGET
jgi:DNA-binding transcriptional ArsR family regulator